MNSSTPETEWDNGWKAENKSLMGNDDEVNHMKTTLIAIAVFVAAVTGVRGAEQEKMPPAARDALAKMDKEIEKARKAAVVLLKRSLQEETTKGNLKTAVMIQEKIDELSDQYSLVGKWKQRGGGEFILKKDGDILVSDGNKGKWTVKNAKLTCEFPNCTMIFELPPKNGALDGTCDRQPVSWIEE